MSSKYTFYCPPEAIAGDVAVLPDGEAHHASRVMRLSQGDAVSMVDGVGHRLGGHIEVLSKRGTTVRITDRRKESPALGTPVTVGAALIKNAGRYETMLEKAAEIGAARVVPLETARTERTRFRPDRADAILVSAMKQSGSAHKTALGAVQDFHDFLASAPEGALKIICHEGAEPGRLLARLLTERPDPALPDIVLAIGPEGGFTDKEIAAAEAGGFQVAWLGPSRLRAETATIVALAVIASHNESSGGS